MATGGDGRWRWQQKFVLAWLENRHVTIYRNVGFRSPRNADGESGAAGPADGHRLYSDDAVSGFDRLDAAEVLEHPAGDAAEGVVMVRHLRCAVLVVAFPGLVRRERAMLVLEDDVMVNLTAETAALGRLDPAAWAEYLEQRSGLPGARANLTLVQAAAESARADVVDRLLQHGGEYQAMCAAAAAGLRAAGDLVELARSLAVDDRWRVREGVVIGLQLLGDREPDALFAIVSDWVVDPDPLVVRAAVAAISEPRLIRGRAAAHLALDICRLATERLLEVPPSGRRRPAARTLRQALGYCWSVAVAADPETGVPAFTALSRSTDPDIAWVVRENRRKKRLERLLGMQPLR